MTEKQKIYRMNNKTGKQETLPTELYMDPALLSIRRAIRKGWVDPVDAEFLLKIFAKEGRADMGANFPKGFDNSKDQIIDTYMEDEGLSHVGRVLAQKQDRMKKKGISFGPAWIGGGTSIYGETGKDYDRLLEQSKVHLDPRNAKVLAHIDNYLSPEFVPEWDTEGLNGSQIKRKQQKRDQYLAEMMGYTPDGWRENTNLQMKDPYTSLDRIGQWFSGLFK
jgi:hypothetical protein